MRFSQSLIPTLKEVPANAEVTSHQLMVRSGMIRQVARGIYNYLPLGLRVIHKIEKIIREEMDQIGCQELLMPIIIPAELWQETGRWGMYGKELLRLQDRSGREFCVGPTHEEVITDLVRSEIRSYRDMPKNLYQINTKFRDEVRPRFGLMRGREFIMKDAYSFHADREDLDRHYKEMFEAYNRIFTRCGLDVRAVEADTGAIGGDFSHEFMVLADSGEAEITVCDSCHYAANIEAAKTVVERVDSGKEESLQEIHTPHLSACEEVARYLRKPLSHMVKTLVYLRDGGLVVALISGQYDLNEIKLKNATGAEFIRLADEHTVQQLTGAAVGFAGAVNLARELSGVGRVTLVADHSVAEVNGGITGANKTDYHLTGLTAGRDFVPDLVADLVLVKTGDRCPACEKGKLKVLRGIEVGQLFKLGTKYSGSMKAHFLDEVGHEQPIVMGCYGIGVGRTAASAIEQNHDAKGIVWPLPIAPYHVHIIVMNVKDEKLVNIGNEFYAACQKSGIEALIDDRDERAGVKFADADLIGIPLHIVVGSKSAAEGKIEFKHRKDDVKELLTPAEAIERVQQEIAQMKRP